MHLLTKSSQPGFMDARNRLVSSEVILPTNTHGDVVWRFCHVQEFEEYQYSLTKTVQAMSDAPRFQRT